MTIWFPQWCPRRALGSVFSSIFISILVVILAVFMFVAPNTARAMNESLTEVPGYISGIATEFSVVGSDYHDIRMESDVLVDASIFSVPGMIDVFIKQVTSQNATISFNNLPQHMTFQLYIDGYEQHQSVTTDGGGSFTLSLDLQEPRYLVLQEHMSTILIRDLPGGDKCQQIGVWNVDTKTCLMTKNATETIQISGAGITLDGDGFSVVGPGTGNGIFLNNQRDITVKNIRIEEFAFDVRMIRGSGNHFHNVKLWDDKSPLQANDVTNVTVSSSTMYDTGSFGLAFFDSSNINIEDNIFTNAGATYALSFINSSDFTVHGNAFTTKPNTTAIGLVNSSNGEFRNNVMEKYGIRIDADTAGAHDHDIDETNMIGGKSILYLQGRANETFSNTHDAGTIFCISCDGVVFENFSTTSPNYSGMYFWDTTNATIRSNSISGTNNGIYFKDSYNNLITRNDFFGNTNDVFIQDASGVDNNKIYQNNFLGGVVSTRVHAVTNDSTLFEPYPVGGNYWQEFDSVTEGCITFDGRTDGICDAPYGLPFIGGFQLIDELPWREKNAWENIVPEISGLRQYKILGKDAIDEGEIFVGNYAVFEASATGTLGGDVQIEIEVKPSNVPFDGTVSTSSKFVPSGTKASTTINELIPKDLHYEPGGNAESFHWRARAVAEGSGLASEWIEFGTPGNTDFSVKVVPLVTQVESEFPPRDIEWAERDYAMGRGNIGLEDDCGLSMAECACLLSSINMIANYYGEFEDIDGAIINPLIFDAWMLANEGYDYAGNLVWDKELEYLSTTTNATTTNDAGEVINIKKKRFSRKYENKTGPTAETLTALQNLEPLVVLNNSHAHWFVVDDVINDKEDNFLTYSLRDPAWFRTKVMNDPGPASTSTRINTYNNVFNRAIVYEHHEELLAYSGDVSFYLGSPAELLITDTQGRRLGFDPVTGTEYNEIPEGVYVEELRVQTSEQPVDVSEFETNKIAHIPNAVEGEYDIQVIGTGDGPYTLSTLVYDPSGESHQETLVGTTSISQVDAYAFKFASSSASSSGFVDENDNFSFEEGLEELRMIAITSNIHPKWLRLRLLGNIYAVEYFYNQDKKKLTKKTLKNLKQLVKKKKNNGIPKADAKKMITIIKQLLVLLKS